MKQNNIHQNNPWDVLHKQERFKPVYPLDHVVRFVFTYFPRNREQRKKLKLLDVGCGAGRHVVLLSQEGFQAYGTDISLEGVRAARDWLKSENLPALVEQAEMSVQPFHDNIFGGIICSGVLNYNTISGMKKTIAELHRILKPLGIMAVITRTIDDYRFGKGTKIEEHTYQLDIDDKRGVCSSIFVPLPNR